MTITLSLTDHAAQLLGGLLEDALAAGGPITGPDSPAARTLLEDLQRASNPATASQPTLMDAEPVLTGGDDEVISRYSRRDALEDGVLVDVSGMAAEVGYDIPVAITRGLAADIAAIPPRYAGEQDEAGRTWDVLYMGFLDMRRLIRKNKDLMERGSEARIMDSVYALQLPVNGNVVYQVKLAFVVEEGAERPAITLMKPGQD